MLATLHPHSFPRSWPFIQSRLRMTGREAYIWIGNKQADQLRRDCCRCGLSVVGAALDSSTHGGQPLAWVGRMTHLGGLHGLLFWQS